MEHPKTIAANIDKKVESKTLSNQKDSSDTKLTNPKKLLKNNKPGHVYIIREREFVNSAEPIYKIGRAENATVRMMKYPKDSEVELVMRCEDMLDCENALKKAFSSEFEKITKVGSEYYSGDIKSMRTIFLQTASSFMTLESDSDSDSDSDSSSDSESSDFNLSDDDNGEDLEPIIKTYKYKPPPVEYKQYNETKSIEQEKIDQKINTDIVLYIITVLYSGSKTGITYLLSALWFSCKYAYKTIYRYNYLDTNIKSAKATTATAGMRRDGRYINW